MTTRQTAWVAIATLTAAALGFAGARAMATGAPQLSPLTYGGVLTDKDGKPYPSAQEVVLKFYDKVDATSPKCTAPAAQAEAGTGRFSVVLPGECAQAVRDTPDLWSEATVGGGKTVLPRVHVGAVPYALEADSAKVAAGATGALKAAMDGVAADVAALKKGGGAGAPKVVDGAGVVLGTLISADILRFYAITSAGYHVYLRPDGAAGQVFAVYFAGPNCTGQKYLATDGSGAMPPVGAIAIYAGITDGWAVIQNGLTTGTGAGGMVSPKSVLTTSGNCAGPSAFPNSTLYLYPLQSASQSDIGLPQKITPPLKIVQ